MDWDPFQREVLDALGLPVLALAAAATGTATHAPPALLAAMARAAGVDAAELAALPMPDDLRMPAAKRALWPRLRALRRGRP